MFVPHYMNRTMPDLGKLAAAQKRKLGKKASQVSMEMTAGPTGEPLLVVYVVLKDEAYKKTRPTELSRQVSSNLAELGPWEGVLTRIRTQSGQRQTELEQETQ